MQQEERKADRLVTKLSETARSGKKIPTLIFVRSCFPGLLPLSLILPQQRSLIASQKSAWLQFHSMSMECAKTEFAKIKKIVLHKNSARL